MSVNPINVKISTATLSAATNQQVLAVNRNRTLLTIQVLGVNSVNVAFDRAATSADLLLNGAASASARGDTLVFDGSGVPTQAVNLISASGATVVIWEGVG